MRSSAGHDSAVASCGQDQKLLLRLTIDDFAIPTSVSIGTGWTSQMIKLADVLGAYDTLRVLECYGGRALYVPRNPALSPIDKLVGAEKARKFAEAFAGKRLQLPLGRDAIHFAKRQAVIALVRAGKLSVTVAAVMLGMARRHLSKVINKTDEGVGVAIATLPEPRGLRVLRSAAQIAQEALRANNASKSSIAKVEQEILELFSACSSVDLVKHV